jgi:hypothetical protein
MYLRTRKLGRNTGNGQHHSQCWFKLQKINQILIKEFKVRGLDLNAPLTSSKLFKKTVLINITFEGYRVSLSKWDRQISELLWNNFVSFLMTIKLLNEEKLRMTVEGFDNIVVAASEKINEN